jgi:hypothetical protein
LEDLEKWWMLVVVEDIKHAGMYGTVKSCSSLSCSISLSIYLSIYIQKKVRILNFHSIYVFFMSFFSFFLALFLLFSCGNLLFSR